MAVQLGLSESQSLDVGIRHGEDRRVRERRGCTRGIPDRRRRERRRARLRSLIFTVMMLALPHQLRQRSLNLLGDAQGPGPHVSTTIDSVVAIPPRHAYEAMIREAAALYRVDAALIRSVMQAESAFNPVAVSRAGAMGLMQLMPEVTRAFEIEDPFDPRANIMGGARLLRELLDSHHGNLALTLASYNAGPSAVARYGTVPPFRETRGYVKKVTSLIAYARNSGNDD